MRFKYKTIVSPLHDAVKLGGVVRSYERVLEKLDGVKSREGVLSQGRLHFFLIMTGGTERSILDAVEEIPPGDPVYLVAHGAQNSLPAALETLAYLRQNGRRGRIFFLEDSEDTQGAGAIDRFLAGCELRSAMMKLRIGVVGEPSSWLVASSPDPQVVSSRWGTVIVPIEMKEFYSEMESIKPAEGMDQVKLLKEKSAGIVEPTPSDLSASVRIYAGLKGLIARYELDALTLKCFDLLDDHAATGCFGLAELNSEGIWAGCEGDLPSLLAMIWAGMFSGETPWMANPARINAVENSLWLAHCTVPLNIVGKFRLRSHFESNIGVGIEGYIPMKPVTLVRLGGRDMDKIWLAEGEISDTGDDPDLCRTQAEVHLTQGHVSELLANPLGNHLVAVLGNHSKEMKEWHDEYIAGRDGPALSQD